MDKLRFQSFGSGSSGNCYFIGNNTYGILIDAGIGIRTIKKNLKDIGFEFSDIWGAFITHDHADHIKAVGPLGEKHLVPIYSTRKVHEGIHNSYCVTEKLYSSRKFIEKDESVVVGDFKITAFPVSHDATDSVGYAIEYKEKKITFATDLGYISEEAGIHISTADYLVLESNYDEDMLKRGLYPPHLKARILADTGHLSNDQVGEYVSFNYSERLKYIFLCHLSKDNNTPQKAFDTVSFHLQNRNIKVGEHLKLVTLNRLLPSDLYEF